jgi:hypothetical protein
VSRKERFIFKTWDESAITVYEQLPLPEHLANAYNDSLRRKYGIANERKKADHRYNCHGLTFIGKHGWIVNGNSQNAPMLVTGESKKIEEIPDERDIIDIILNGNLLRRVRRLNNRDVDRLAGDEDIKIGDIAVYKDNLRGREEILHTALVVELRKLNISNKFCDIKVLSKMGHGGEYFHSYWDVPIEFGLIIEFWTDREVR